jgi:hypothetical protein
MVQIAVEPIIKISITKTFEYLFLETRIYMKSSYYITVRDYDEAKYVRFTESDGYEDCCNEVQAAHVRGHSIL